MKRHNLIKLKRIDQKIDPIYFNSKECEPYIIIEILQEAEKMLPKDGLLYLAFKNCDTKICGYKAFLDKGKFPNSFIMKLPREITSGGVSNCRIELCDREKTSMPTREFQIIVK